MQYDWAGITTLAYQTLLELDLHDFPIPENKIKCKGVKIISYQKYAEKTGLSIEEITLGHEINDAFLLETVHTNECIGNHRKIYEARKDNIQFIISRKDFAKTLQS